MDRGVKRSQLSDDTALEVEEAQVQRWRAMHSTEKAGARPQARQVTPW
jgi:hypothetical protein